MRDQEMTLNELQGSPSSSKRKRTEELSERKWEAIAEFRKSSRQEAFQKQIYESAANYERNIEMARNNITKAKQALAAAQLEQNEASEEESKEIKATVDRLSRTLRNYQSILKEAGEEPTSPQKKEQATEKQQMPKLPANHVIFKEGDDLPEFLAQLEKLLELFQNAAQTTTHKIINMCLSPEINERIGKQQTLIDLARELAKDKYGEDYLEEIKSELKREKLNEAWTFGMLRSHHSKLKRVARYFLGTRVRKMYSDTLPSQLALLAANSPSTTLEEITAIVKEFARKHEPQSYGAYTNRRAQASATPREKCKLHPDAKDGHTNEECLKQKELREKVERRLTGQQEAGTAKPQDVERPTCGYCKELTKKDPRVRYFHLETNCFRKNPELRKERMITLKSMNIDVLEEEVLNSSGEE